jgi:hypothetical protein
VALSIKGFYNVFHIVFFRSGIAFTLLLSCECGYFTFYDKKKNDKPKIIYKKMGKVKKEKKK